MMQDVGDVRLYYEIHGDDGNDQRPWVVFSHSLACTTAMWTPQVREFSRSNRVLLFDTRGHGRSDSPAGLYTIEMLARDAYRLLTALGIRRAHFVGLSMGGMIGQALTLEHPEMIASLTLADTTSRWPAEAIDMFAQRANMAAVSGMSALVESTLARWFTPPFHDTHPHEVSAVGEMIRSTPVAGYAGCSHAIPRVDLTDRLKRIACPVLVMVGEHDNGTPPAMAREIHDNLPGSEFVVIKDASHLSNIEQAAAFSRELSAFLNRMPAPAEDAESALQQEVP